MMEKNVHILELATYEKPEVVESTTKDWVEYGKKNDYYEFLIQRYKNSTTSNAVINNVARLIYGRGIDALNSSKKPNEYASLKAMISPKVLRGIALNFKMLGAGYFQVLYNKNHTKIIKIDYLPTRLIRAGRCNEEGVIDTYFYSDNWEDVRKNPPRAIPAFGTSKEAIELDVVKFDSVDMKYYNDVDWHGGIPYAVLEEEISDYLITDVQQGFSGTKVVNFNNGIPDEEAQRQISNQVKGKLTGAKGDKVIIAFNANQESKTTIEDISLDNASERFAQLSNECQSKILNAHTVISPMIVGITTENSGFSSNAQEIEMATKVFYNQSVAPFQDAILERIDEYLAFNGFALDLYFKRLDLMSSTEKANVASENVASTAMNGAQITSLVSIVESVTSGLLSAESGIQVITAGFPAISEEKAKGIIGDSKKKKEEAVKMAKHYDDLVSQFGEDEDPEWELIDSREVDYDLEDDFDAQVKQWEEELSNKKKTTLSKIWEFVSTGTARSNAKSSQDKQVGDLYFKTRYKYVGNPNPERGFCKAMMSANKIYRKEDIINMGTASVNAGFGEAGADNYSIWLYKGGARCHHKFQRLTYLAKSASSIDVKSPKANTKGNGGNVSPTQAQGKYGYKVNNDSKVKQVPNNMPLKGFSPNNPNLPSDVQ